MNSLGRRGGNFADSFPGVEGECLDASGNGAAPGFVCGPDKSCVLLIEYGNGADGFCSNAGSGNDVRLSTVEEDGFGECCNGIVAENGISGSAGFNACVNVAEMTCAARSCNGKASDDLNRVWLDGACENNVALVGLRNGTEANGFEVGNKDCTCQACSGVENASSVNGNCDRMDGPHTFHNAAASEDGTELPLARRGTEDGCGVGDLCSKESEMQKRLHSSFLCNGCGNSLEMGCQLIDGVVIGRQDWLCVNVASAVDEEPSAAVRTELVDDSENPLRTDYPFVDCNGKRDSDGKDAQDRICSYVAPLDDEEPSVTVRNESGEGGKTSSGTDCPVEDDNRRIYGNGDGGQGGLCFKIASVGDEKPLVTMRKELKDSCDNPPESAYPLVDGIGENGNGLCLNVTSADDEELSAYVKNDVEVVSITSSEMAQPKMNHVGESGKIDLCFKADSVENEELLAATKTDLEDGYVNSLEAAFPLIDGNGLCSNVDPVNVSEPWVVRGNVGIDEFGAKKLCSGNRDDMEHCEDALVTAHHLINGRLHLDVASKNNGEPSSTEGNDTTEESRHSSHESDMESQMCNSNLWDRRENLSEAVYPTDDVADAFRSYVSSENEVEPSICVNGDDDAQRGGAFFSKRSDWKTSVCTSQLSNGHGNIMGPSSTLTDNNADVMEGQNEVGLGVISGNNREALIAGKLHPDERHVDGQSCCLLQVNSCEDALQMTCSLNSAADMLDCLPDEPQIKIASLDDSEAWIIEKEGIVGYGVCSSSSENDTANRLSMGSMNDGPYPDKAVPLSLLKVPSHNEEMSLSSLVTKNEKMENYVSGSSEETASSFREVEQERSLIEACILTGPATHTSCSGGNSIEGSPSEVFHCSVEELALTHSKCSTGLGYTEKDATASAVVFSECADNEAKFSSQLDHVFRNNGSCKSNRSSRTRKAARQCQQAANTIGVFLNNARRKRSYSSERRRSSLWGSMGNIVQLFKQGAEILKFDSQLTKMLNQGSKSGKAVSGRRRQLKTHNRGTTRGSQAKVCASAKRAQLNVKKEEGGERSLESVPSEVVDSSASVLTINGCSPESDCCVGLEVPKSASEVECKFEGDACDVQGFPFIDQNLKKLENRLEISARDAHGGDKDIESTVTQEMSIENTSGHYPGVSHGSLAEASGEAVENMHPYPGMTPGMNSLPSIPVVGISSTEGAVYTRRKTSSKSRMKDQNGFIADPTVPSCLDDAVSIPPDAIAAPVNVMPPKMNCPSTKEVTTTTSGEVKEGQHESAGCSSFEEKLVCPAKLNKARKSTRQRLMPKMAGDFDAVGNCRITSGKDSNQTSNSGMLTKKSLVLDATEAESWKGTFKVDPEVGIRECFGQDVGISQSEPCKSDGLLTAGKIKEHKPQKRSADASRKCRSRATDSAKHGRRNAHGGKKNSRKKDKCTRLSRHVPYKEEMRAVADGAESGEIHEEGNSIFSNQGRNSNNDAVVSEDIVNSVKSPVYNDKALTKSCDALEVQCLQPQVAWVRCDDCFKWRCISAALADEIEETNRKWTCKDNMDKAFADCSIPQEKSNAEINAELEISDASCEEDSCGTNPVSKGSERKQLGASQQATWTLIKSNIFLQRSCKTQTIDEVMVCQCKPTLDGSLGCRDECLNRMLNIECVKGTCPCGNLCSNQQFQKRKYAKFKWIRCGKKGYGLELQEDVSKGTFLIEYVGEVLDLHTYEGRQRDYAARGQKHFYFMTLNGSEVIDACAKGNLGRFINHSCDPNCRTEKWMVNGEVCIGLFAVRDIKKGEEVTFDYNYVRVFGAAAKKCFCGSSECRGYIGGDLQSTEVIVQGDSDDEYPEPVMVCDDGDSDHNLDEMIPRASSLGVAYKQHAEISSGMIRGTGKSSPTVQLLEDSSQKQHSTKKSSPHSQQFDALQIEDVTIKSSPRQHFGDNLEEDSMSKLLASAPKSEIFFETDDSKSKSLSCVEPHEISSEIASVMGVPFAVAVDDKSMPTSGTVEKKPDLSKCPISRSSRSSGTIKKGKCSSYQLMANKLKRVADGSGRSHFEGVEQKLNELLDADGGISKRKDATKGYLKLLFVTAASGDHTEASHSTRDLSLVLDALLKTKSRMVLVDIMNKNGLQMLHNIMKQSRLNFNKTPILRKLLKVLEFLALKEILTLEHINTAPPCVGMESFKESMLSLTRHSDSQVHQIARSFRDRWIPRTIKQFYSERDDCRLESQNGYCNRFLASHKRWHGQGLRQSDAIHCISQTLPASVPLDDSTPVATSLLPSQLGSEAPSADNAPTDGMKRKRRRKSRWDQPVETNLDPQPLQYIEHQTVEMNSNFKTQASLSQPETCAEVLSHASESHGETTKTNLNDDGPPGFSLPFKNHQVSSIAPFSVTCSFSPSQVPQSSGVCEAVIAHPQPRFLAHLPVSFGIPLALVQQLGTPQGEDWLVAPGMPFHPFPPLPPYPRGQTNLPSIQASVVDDNRLVDEAREQHGGDCGCAEDARVASNGGAQEIAANGANNPHTVGRVRWASDSLGRRFFRQQKWNNKEFRKCPPWLRPRNGWGFKGNNHVRSMSSQQSV